VSDRFEVYPPAAEAAGQPDPDPQPAWEQPDTASPVERVAVTPYVPPPIPPPTTGPSRRGVMGLVVGVPVALFWLGSLNNPATRMSSGWEEESGGSTWPDDGSETDAAAMSIGDDSFEVPDGWEVTQVSDVEAVATNGANRVQAYGFTADTADRAVDLIAALVKHRLGALKGTLDQPVDESVDNLQQATIRGSGKLSGKAARLVGTLWIDADGTARLAVKVVSAKKGSDIAQEAQGIIDELSLW
jgi:hypothetical protein